MPFLPILFPFFFLIYADIFSLLLIVSSALAFIKTRKNVGYFLCILSVCVRQSNIIWLLFFFCLTYLEDYSWEIQFKNILEHGRKSWLCIFGFLAFATFVIFNNGVSIGHSKFHPSFSFHSGNIFFYLFVLAVLCFPMFLANWRNLISSMRNWKYSLPVIFVVCTLFFLTFKVDNPLNGYQNHLRNQLLYFFNETRLNRIILALFCLFALMGISSTKLFNKRYYLIYPATILFLSPAWLIEQRYYLVPFTLFLLYRKPRNLLAELFQCLLYFIGSAWLTIKIVDSKDFFL